MLCTVTESSENHLPGCFCETAALHMRVIVQLKYQYSDQSINIDTHVGVDSVDI